MKREQIDFLEKEHKGKKPEEIAQAEKDDLDKMRRDLDSADNRRQEILSSFTNENKLVKQLIDLALLANNMLKGEELSRFVQRSVELLK